MGTTGRIEELLAAWERAADKPPPELLCADCPELIDQLRARIHARTAETVAPDDDGNGPTIEPPPFTEPMPKQIGPYRVVAVLGEGGMGSVYRAEQRSPIKRVVAIKVIKSGYDTKEVIARFESERQALARMDHPNIARVLDAGATVDTARPYFVMEYVPGAPLPRFCDENKLSLAQRLELFCQVCDAITHAHTKAIIHRDIKSSNVLGFIHDGKPTVKVIDFGIAKALTGDRLTDLTFVTDLGRAIGTYDSMSPEQADASPDIDTRTDVYSLGVLLYELLAGAKPFDRSTLANVADHELRRIIREVDPPRLDTRLGSLGPETATRVATLRQHSLAQLSEALRGELGWIPLKAMRKERSRRYESPRQLADDIQNYLHRRPLLAGPESQVYRLRKWVSRYRYPIGAAVGSTLVLLIATIVSIYFAKQARHIAALETAQRKRADENAALAEARAAEIGQRALQYNRQFADRYNHFAANEFERGDVPKGLLWLARAIEFEDRDPDPARARVARVAFNLGLQRAPRLFNGSSEPLPTLVTANGRRVRTQNDYANGETRVAVVDVRSGREISHWLTAGQLGRISTTISPDGGRVATLGHYMVDRKQSSATSGVRVWEATTGKPLTDLLTAEDDDKLELRDVDAAMFSPDGTRLLMLGSRRPRVFDAGTGRRLVEIATSNVCAATFSPDGKRIYTADTHDAIYGWDAATGAQVGSVIRYPGASAYAMCVSADGKRLAVVQTTFSGVGVWNIEGCDAVNAHIAQDIDSYGALLDTKGERVLIWDDHQAGVFSVETGLPLVGPTKLREPTIDPDDVTSELEDEWADLWLAPDGSGLASPWKGTGALLYVGERDSLTPPMQHGGGIYNAFFSADGRTIATAGRQDHTARVWDAADGRPITPPLKHDAAVRFVAFDPAGRRVVTAGSDRRAKVWDARSGELLLTLATSAPCWRAIFSPDGTRIATGSEGSAVELWDAATGKPLLTTKGLVAGEPSTAPTTSTTSTTNPTTAAAARSPLVSSLAFSPDGQRLAAASTTTRLWRVEDGSLIATLDNRDGGEPTPPGLFFSADGTRLLGRDGVFDGRTGARIAGFDHAVNCALSPDGTRAAVTVGDQQVRLLDTANGHPVSPLLAHGSAVNFVSFSHDGLMIVAASDDNVVRVFATRTGQVLGRITMLNDAYTALFSPDDRRVLVGCADHTATLWSIEPDSRPAEDLRRHAELLSRSRLDEFDGVVAVADDALTASWRRLVTTYPQQFPPLTPPPTSQPAR